MCGENFLNNLVCRNFTGSPPHVRGKLYRSGVDYRDSRITPACAGKIQVM